MTSRYTKNATSSAAVPISTRSTASSSTAGPTVLTVPDFFDEIFEAAGRRREDYFTLTPLDPFYRIFDQNGRGFNYWRGTDETIAEIEKFNPADVDGYRRYVRLTEEVFRAFNGLTERPFLRLTDMLKIMPDIIRLQAFLGTYTHVARYIKDDFLRRVFSFHPLLVGGNPFDTPSVYTLVAQFEKQWGVHYAIGGTGAAVAGLGKLFTDLGGKVYFNTEIKEIVTKDRRVVGVRLPDGTVDTADVVSFERRRGLDLPLPDSRSSTAANTRTARSTGWPTACRSW